MCLLVVMSRVHPDAPLVVAANRDELVARPAVAMTVLREAGPRTLGGRDGLAGGTWMAVNEHGVVAGLTNVPFSRDPARRSRGELPLIATAAADARGAAEALGALRAGDFNPCWMLVGDRRALYYVDFSGGAPSVRALGPGLHVLENRSLGAASPKVDRVQRAAAAALSARGAALVDRLRGVLADHEIPDGDDPARPRETFAACVHAGYYATRSAQVIVVPPDGAPRVWSADGPPCTTPLVEFSWSS
jgi:uncharacterized protein with NRDE domain